MAIIAFIFCLYFITTCSSDGALTTPTRSTSTVTTSGTTPSVREFWTKEEYPNPRRDVTECGRHYQSYVCDPNTLTTQQEKMRMDEVITKLENETSAGCTDSGYIFAVAFVSQITTKHGLPLDKLAATQDFAKYLQRRSWVYGTCGEEGIIVISIRDKKAYTVVGADTAQTLKSLCIQAIFEEAADKHFKYDQWAAGALYLLDEYRAVLNGSRECHDDDWIIPVAIIVSLTFILSVTSCVLILCCKDKCKGSGSTGSSAGHYTSFSDGYSGGGYSSGGGGGYGAGGGGGW